MRERFCPGHGVQRGVGSGLGGFVAACSARSPIGPILLALGGLVGCGEAGSKVQLADLEGPRGTAAAPGPWAVQVLAEGGVPAVFWALDDGAEAELVLRDLGDGRFVGALPDAPVGALLRYRAQLDGVALPPAAGVGAGHRVRVTGPVDPAIPLRPCTLAVREPQADAVLDAGDDARPEAGLQVAVVVDGDLADGERARLHARLDGAEMPEPSGGYVALAEGGSVAFLAVTLRPGTWRLSVEAVPTAGAACSATLAVTVTEGPP